MQIDRGIKDLSEFLYRETGVLIKEEKYFLLKNRLQKRLRELGVDSFQKYYSYLRKNNEEIKYFISQMTTHKTSFYRESCHFDMIEQWISENPRKEWYFLSAACSTGEEVYSLAALLESLKNRFESFHYRILGIDICQQSIETASRGHYHRGRELIQENSKNSYFDIDGERVSPKEVLRKNIKFRVMNLMNLSMPERLRFDVILLRNVLIYFDNDGIERVIKNLAPYHQSEGKLVVGLSENIKSDYYRPIGSSVYVKAS